MKRLWKWFLIGLAAFALANLASVGFRSDAGLLEGLGIADNCADDIRGFGFPFLVWEEGGFAYRNHFSRNALLLNVAIAVAASAAASLVLSRLLPGGGKQAAKRAAGL